ncbi:MAG: UDP-N-acetylmuramate dehydrogenase [Clostridia bacterium]|nr:UDP-N-acetylmuramate dehydrogenase [Clostridia bacterium]
MDRQNDLLNRISEICEAKADEPMSLHTSFKIGGPADIFAEPRSTEELVSLLTFLQGVNEPFIVIGNGTNLLVRDEGFRGTVIKIGKGFSDFSVDGLVVKAGAGMTLAALAKRAGDASVSGFEELSGIPGTVGGAVRMNAGAYGVSVSDLLVSVTYFDGEKLKTISDDEADLSYRHSIFCDIKNAVIVEAVFEGRCFRPKEEIAAAQAEYNERRRNSQPLDFPSAGSTFKRPASGYASRLIDECGLKGCRVGGAEVSQKHAGFVINTGGATACDVLALMEKVEATVLEKTGVELEPEIVIV